MELEHPRTWIEQNPDHPAIIMAGSGQVVTRIQLEGGTNQCAHMLRDMGLETGDHIAILMENTSRFLEICQAAERAGLVYTAISTHLTGPEVEYIINDCGAKAFFTSTNKSDIASQIADRIPNVTARLMVNGIREGYDSYEEKVASYPKES